jgi:hypothetical protein
MWFFFPKLSFWSEVLDKVIKMKVIKLWVSALNNAQENIKL